MADIKKPHHCGAATFQSCLNLDQKGAEKSFIKQVYSIPN
jgi:hypothetical protein